MVNIGTIMNKYKKNIPTLKNGNLTVDRQRKRFLLILPDCGGPDRLSVRLGKIDEYFNSIAGYNDVRNAKREKAGEAAMNRILAAMELLAATDTPSAPPSRVDKAFARMNIGTTYEPKYETTKKLKAKMQSSKFSKS